MEETKAVEEVWIHHKQQIPTRLTAWTSEYEKYKKVRGENMINSIDESMSIMNQPTYAEQLSLNL